MPPRSRHVARRSWLLIAAMLFLLAAAYLVYDWTRPCVGGPVRQFVMAALNGGSFTVRCAG